MKTDTITRPSDTGTGKDDLSHIFCSRCMKADKRRAKKPSPFCGKEKDGPWVASSDKQQICQMCVLLAQGAPCPRCGMKSII